MKQYLAGALMLLLTLDVSADTAELQAPPQRQSDANITGHVVDARTGEHLAYATVTVEGTTIGLSTDATGHYFLKNLPTGRFTLVASSVGYGSARQEVETAAGKTLEVNFSLEEEVLSVDEVVVSASRTERNKRYSPTIVSVVGEKLFDATSSCNLAESMSFQSGLRVENNCGNCGTMQLRINGLEGQYSQVLLDSRPIFSTLATVYGLEQLPASMIERVEVIRGGGSALFGANAIGGVVNIITREPQRNTVSLAGTTNILEGGSVDFNTSLNGAFVSDDYRTGVYLFGMVRERDAYDRNGDGFSDIPKLDSETAGFRAYYKTSAYTRLTAEYHHIHEFRRGGNAFDQPPHNADIAEQLDHKIDGGGLKFDYFSPDNRHRLGLYLSAQNIDRNSYYGAGRNPDAYGATSDRTLVAGAQYTYSFERLWFSPAELTAGVEYNGNALHDRYLGLGRDLRQTTHSAGFFFQNEWSSDRFSLLLGGRVDKHNLMRNVVFSPRVNLRYTPHEQVGLRLSYSSGYRAPPGLQRGPAYRRARQQGLAHRARPRPAARVLPQRERFGRPLPHLRARADEPARRGLLDAAGRCLHARENRRERAGLHHPRAAQRLGCDRRRRECRAEGRHSGPLRGAGGLHLPAQPLRRARAVVRRGDAAAPHVPLARPLRLPDGVVYPRARLYGLALRHLHGTDARAAQCRLHRRRHRADDPLVLGHGHTARL